MLSTSSVRLTCFARNLRLPKYCAWGWGRGDARSRQGDTCADLMSRRQKQLSTNKIKCLMHAIPVKISHLPMKAHLNGQRIPNISEDANFSRRIFQI